MTYVFDTARGPLVVEAADMKTAIVALRAAMMRLNIPGAFPMSTTVKAVA